ncbi:HAD-IA family hydrolase [Bacillus sp. Marseille-P3661]|uniref:HAD-IA family hydrolase n=1 Tax=Bacillus sp. Marseille-P3661 TaxID=1936234 RepID=UPI000C819BEE|nr:HAD-IA family hydrolase [Bacillus sp. Marseille-P3661]
MLKYVIFDFDGTLADSKLVFIAAYNALADKHQYKKISLDDLEMLKKLSIKERAKQLQFPLYKLPFLLPQLFQLYRQSLDQIQLFKGIDELLCALKQKGYKIAIISSNSQDNIIEILERNKIGGISSILCSNRIFGKDRLIKRFLRNHKLKASEVIYVGDEQRDIKACKKAGIKMIWVGWGYDDVEVIQSSQPEYMVNNPADILKIV